MRQTTQIGLISFCILSSVTFTISPLTIPNTSVLISIYFCTFLSVTFTISQLTYLRQYTERAYETDNTDRTKLKLESCV
jgi:hypothetical protein